MRSTWSDSDLKPLEFVDAEMVMHGLISADQRAIDRIKEDNTADRVLSRSYYSLFIVGGKILSRARLYASVSRRLNGTSQGRLF